MYKSTLVNSISVACSITVPWRLVNRCMHLSLAAARKFALIICTRMCLLGRATHSRVLKMSVCVPLKVCLLLAPHGPPWYGGQFLCGRASYYNMKVVCSSLTKTTSLFFSWCDRVSCSNVKVMSSSFMDIFFFGTTKTIMGTTGFFMNILTCCE